LGLAAMWARRSLNARGGACIPLSTSQPRSSHLQPRRGVADGTCAAAACLAKNHVHRFDAVGVSSAPRSSAPRWPWTCQSQRLAALRVAPHAHTQLHRQIRSLSTSAMLRSARGDGTEGGGGRRGSGGGGGEHNDNSEGSDDHTDLPEVDIGDGAFNFASRMQVTPVLLVQPIPRPGPSGPPRPIEHEVSVSVGAFRVGCLLRSCFMWIRTVGTSCSEPSYSCCCGFLVRPRRANITSCGYCIC
jgi:hypothetical protein